MSAPAAPVANERRFGGRGIFAAVLGNGFEFYDFGVYAAYAVMIGKVFFPSHSAFASLMASVATFGAGFVSRPLGGLLIGTFGDRMGRKPAMMLTIGLMAVGSGLIGITPGYDSIGVLAPILLVAGRLIQGFAAGGELGPATMFMLESAPASRRCFFGSWQMASQNISSIFVGLTGFILAKMLPPESLNGWGWRIPFLLGILIAPVGLYIRNRLHDSTHATNANASAASFIGDFFSRHLGALLLAMAMISGATISQYFVLNMPTYAITVLHMPTSIALFGMFVIGVSGAITALIGGLLADRFGVKWVSIVPRVALLLTILPMMSWLVASPDTVTYAIVVAWMIALNAISGAAGIVLIPYCVPASIRSTGLSVSYAFGVMLFGGTAAMIVTWLVHRLADPLAGVYYVMAMNVVTIAATLAVNLRGSDAPQGVPAATAA